MNYIEFRNNLKSFAVFSISDIHKLYPQLDSRRLVEWQQKGYLQKIINRWYCFSDSVINEEFLYLAANSIYSPSYVSFETALAYYKLIPEATYTITSATTLKTNEFKTTIGVFSYSHLKPSVFLGYNLAVINNHRVKIADMEKTLLDYFYINEKMNSPAAFEGMRINKEMLFAQLNIKRLNAYLKLYKNMALERRLNEFIQFSKHA